jgi:glycosyltransferase involved in cell wall biosynthesis
VRTVRNYILHFGQIAGISYYDALALRRMGIDSINVVPMPADTGGTDRTRYNRHLPFDKALYAESAGTVARFLKEMAFCLSAARQCSLVHYYSAKILRGSLDYRLFKTLGIPMIISWAGGDARIIEMARKHNPYFYREPDNQRDRAVRGMLQAVSRHIKYVATDHEMAEYSAPYFEKVFIVPQPIDLDECTLSPPAPETRSPVVLHIPTHLEVKGTAHIEAAVARLSSEGVPMEFRALEPNLTQREVRRKIAEADIYIDELRCGSYGITAVEAMASAKPTITYIREDLVEKYPRDLPLVNANPDTIYGQLKKLLLDSDRRRRIGLASRAYAERYHSLVSVGNRLLEVYRQIGLRA